MIDTALIDTIIHRCSLETSGNDFLPTELQALSHEEFSLAFSQRVASEYLEGRLAFEAADTAMNWLYSFSYVSEDRGMPDLAWEVFIAFDEGEYRHEGDSDDTDPELKYTPPTIERIVARSSTE